MQLAILKINFFKKRNTNSSLFSSALSDGIKDTLKEMGYGSHRNDENGKNENTGENHFEIHNNCSPIDYK